MRHKETAAEKNMRANLTAARHSLKLSQQKFIDTFLKDDDGNNLIGVSSLSILENRGSRNLPDYCRRTAERLGVDPAIFELDTTEFVEILTKHLDKTEHSGDRELHQLIRDAADETPQERLVKRINEYIMDGVISGDMKPGDKLPSDRQLSDMFGVGRSQLREAMNVLNVMGLVDILPGQGSFLSVRRSESLLVPLSWGLLLQEGSVEQIVNARSVMEIGAACTAARECSKKTIEKLKAVKPTISFTYARQHREEFPKIDANFHRTIAECSENVIILNILDLLRRIIESITASSIRSDEQLRAICKEHDAIYKAIVSGDQEAAFRSMIIHMRNLLQRYRDAH